MGTQCGSGRALSSIRARCVRLGETSRRLRLFSARLEGYDDQRWRRVNRRGACDLPAFVSRARACATLGVGVDADGRRVVGMDVWAARVLGFRGVEWDQSRGRSSDDEDDVDARFGSRLTKTFTSFSITWMHRRVPPSFAQTSVVVFGRGRCERTGTLEMPRSARQTRREYRRAMVVSTINTGVRQRRRLPTIRSASRVVRGSTSTMR
jgi:hypothetical protein